MFSPNTIKIDVFCDCPNLSFVDLPGVIQAAGTVNGKPLPTYNVDIVRSLATRYVRDTNNIMLLMLLMLPMNHDTANIALLGIIREQNAQSRTVAVFTKPDRVLLDEQHENLHAYFSHTTIHEFMGHHMVMLEIQMDLLKITLSRKSHLPAFQRAFSDNSVLDDLLNVCVTFSLPKSHSHYQVICKRSSLHC